MTAILVLVVVVRIGIQDGTWLQTVPALVVVFPAGYLARDFLVCQLVLVRGLMNAVAVAVAVAAVFIRAAVPEKPPWLETALVAFIGACLSIYF